MEECLGVGSIYDREVISKLQGKLYCMSKSLQFLVSLLLLYLGKLSHLVYMNCLDELFHKKFKRKI